MDPLYDKSHECLYCNVKFKSKNVRRSFIRVDVIDDDSCYHYIGEANPYFYEVIGCPNCGFVFTPRFIVNNRNQSKIKNDFIDKLNSVNDYSGKRNINQAIQLWTKALACAQVSNQSSEIKSGLAMRIAWLYRYNNDEREFRFLNMARNGYIKAYTNDELISGEAQVANIICQISFRLRDLKGATRWINEMYKYRDMKMISKAKAQLDDLRDLMQENQLQLQISS